MTDRVVRDDEATAITGLGRSRRYELAREGRFPTKIKLSERASGYRLSELEAWLESRPRVDSDDEPERLRQARGDAA